MSMIAERAGDWNCSDSMIDWDAEHDDAFACKWPSYSRTWRYRCEHPTDEDCKGTQRGWVDWLRDALTQQMCRSTLSYCCRSWIDVDATQHWWLCVPLSVSFVHLQWWFFLLSLRLDRSVWLPRSLVAIICNDIRKRKVESVRSTTGRTFPIHCLVAVRLVQHSVWAASWLSVGSLSRRHFSSNQAERSVPVEKTSLAKRITLVALSTRMISSSQWPENV